VSAVQHGDREQVQHGQVDAQKSHEENEIHDALFDVRPRHLGDRNGTAQRIRGDDALDHLDDADDGELRDAPGLLDPGPQRPEGVLAVDEGVLRRPDADLPGVEVLAEDALPPGHLRLDAQVLLRPVPLDPHDEFPALAVRDRLRQLAPPDHAPAVDGDDGVPGPDPGCLRGRPRLDTADLRGEARHAHHVQDGEGQDGEQEIEQGAGDHDRDLLQHVLLDKRAPLVRGQHIVGVRLAQQLDVAPQRHERDHVLRFAHLFPDEPGAEPQRELEHAHPEGLGQQEMPQFVDEDEDPQQYDDRYDVDTHGNVTLLLFS